MIQNEAPDTGDRELVSIRVIDAPRERVFRAWTDPLHLAQWWGPKGFTNTFKEFDPRPGGHWRFIMHGPNGSVYPNHSLFKEITEPERIILEHLSWPHFALTATFEDVGGKTRITFRQLFETAEDCAKVKGFAPDGNEQNLDRLEAELAKIE